jgi:hypothetical protein
MLSLKKINNEKVSIILLSIIDKSKIKVQNYLKNFMQIYFFLQKIRKNISNF